MENCSDKMADDGGHAGSGAGASASTSSSGSQEGSGGRDCSPGVPDLRPHSSKGVEEEMELLLDQVAEVGRGLATIKRGRRKMTNPLSPPYSAETWEGQLLQAEEARDKLIRLVTELRKCVDSERREVDNANDKPFGIFPVEVWEIILTSVVDSRDIENVFRAYPWLEGRVMKNKYWWLIDQVVPHIFPWLRTKDVLTSRQVCKRWNYGVDNFLENHPQQRGYDFGSPLTGQVWIPGASRAYYELGTRFRGVKPFHLREQMEQFEQSMINHPPGKNVFVGRLVKFRDLEDTDYSVRNGNSAFWKKAIEFLATFGEHVWFIEIYDYQLLYRSKEFGRFCDFVFQILSRLPNLKSLHMPGSEILKFDGSTVEAMETMELSLQSFPRLPQLETISMPCLDCGNLLNNVLPECFIKFLVMSSSNTIKRLRLCPCRCKWMVGRPGAAVLPNLTEFALLICTAREIVPVILRSLGAPKLGCLEIELHRNEASLLKGAEIVSWSKLFPSLHSLKLSASERGSYDAHSYYKSRQNVVKSYDLSAVYPDEFEIDYSNQDRLRSNSLSSLADSISSLTSLLFEKCPIGMEFDFLKCFPNLEYLKIDCPRLRSRYLETEVMCGSGLWEMLHKLKEISVPYNIAIENGEQFVKLHFFRSREEYEWLKQKMSDPIPEGLFETPDSILVRLERSEHSSLEDAVPRHLLLTSGDYEVKCIQLGVYTLSPANIYQGEAEWSRLLSWIDALNFLRKHGDSVQRLEFRSDLAGSLAEFYRLVFEVTSLLPNLKGLGIWGFDVGDSGFHLSAAQEFKLLLAHAQPRSPSFHHLETLKIHGSGLGEALVPPGIVKFLVMSCSETLKKLEANPHDWVKIKDFVELPSLVELKMECFTEKSQVNEAFQSFKAPNLMNLDFNLRIENDDLVSGGDIVSWLKYFPRIETCKLWIWDQSSWMNRKVDEERMLIIRECGFSSPASLAVPTLKSFCLMGRPSPYELGLKFLYCFPNLENLELIAENWHPYFDEHNLGGSEIWERLPKLQKISAINDRGGSYGEKANFYKTRAQYESSERTEAKPGTPSILQCSSSTSSCQKSDGEKEPTPEGNDASGFSSELMEYEDDDDW